MNTDDAILVGRKYEGATGVLHLSHHTINSTHDEVPGGETERPPTCCRHWRGPGLSWSSGCVAARFICCQPALALLQELTAVIEGIWSRDGRRPCVYHCRRNSRTTIRTKQLGKSKSGSSEAYSPPLRDRVGEDDVQPKDGRFHGSTSVQRHCGLLGAWNRGSIWDDHTESISKLVTKDRASENVVAGDHDRSGDRCCGCNEESDVSARIGGCWTSGDERGSFVAGQSGGRERVKWANCNGLVIASNITFASAARPKSLVSIPSSLLFLFLSPLFSSIMPRWNRTMVLATSIIGALFNSILAIQLFALWRSLRRDSESEWEGSLDPWTVNTISLLGGLSAAYFVTAAVASAIGFAGIVKGIPAYLRFYRDFSVADFTFCTISTVFVTYASFSCYSIRSVICEELSRHGDLMRDLAEIGLSPENCEQWFERAVLVFLAVMFIIIVLRLHLVIVVANYYKQVSRISREIPSRAHKDGAMQRIYLLPTHSTSAQRTDSFDSRTEPTALVYAPIALGDLSEQEVQGLNVQEAWVHTHASHPPRQHRHSHSRGHRHSTGRIALPMQPDEGLLRGHEKYKD